MYAQRMVFIILCAYITARNRTGKGSGKRKFPRGGSIETARFQGVPPWRDDVRFLAGAHQFYLLAPWKHKKSLWDFLCFFTGCRGRESNPRRQPLPRHVPRLLRGSDYIIPALRTYLSPEGGVGRYLQDYCWDSLASLYTFPATSAV